jgi:hypothetical protein
MTVETDRPETAATVGTPAGPPVEEAMPPSGPAAAAMLAAGVGALVLGIFTTLSEGVVAIHDWLQFNDGVGPLSGKTILAVATFFGAWALLTVAWRHSNPPLKKVAVITTALVILGFVGTFPIFFQAFAAE